MTKYKVLIVALLSPKWSNHSTRSSTQIRKGKVHKFEVKTQKLSLSIDLREIGESGAWTHLRNFFFGGGYRGLTRNWKSWSILNDFIVGVADFPFYVRIEETHPPDGGTTARSIASAVSGWWQVTKELLCHVYTVSYNLTLDILSKTNFIIKRVFNHRISI